MPKYFFVSTKTSLFATSLSVWYLRAICNIVKCTYQKFSFKITQWPNNLSRPFCQNTYLIPGQLLLVQAYLRGNIFCNVGNLERTLIYSIQYWRVFTSPQDVLIWKWCVQVSFQHCIGWNPLWKIPSLTEISSDIVLRFWQSIIQYSESWWGYRGFQDKENSTPWYRIVFPPPSLRNPLNNNQSIANYFCLSKLQKRRCDV